MNVQKVKRVHDLILKAGRIYNTDNREWIEVSYFDVENDPDNEVLFFMWEDDDGNEFRVKVTEAGLDAATVADKNLTVIDDEGEPFTIRLYELKQMEVDIDGESVNEELLKKKFDSVRQSIYDQKD